MVVVVHDKNTCLYVVKDLASTESARQRMNTGGPPQVSRSGLSNTWCLRRCEADHGTPALPLRTPGIPP